MTGIEPDRLRFTVGDSFTKAGRKVLLVVDDVPPNLPAEVLDQLLIPSPMVCTVLTGREAAPQWDTPSIALGGLSPADSAALFFAGGQPATHEETDAVRELTERSDGHPWSSGGPPTPSGIAEGL